MSTKFVGWALAHRSKMVGQSPTLQRSVLHGLSLICVLFVILFIILLCPVVWLMMSHRHHPPGIDIRQKAQFKSIEVALELFNSEFNGYPPSDAMDQNDRPYCSAMKLCEAIMGQDLIGFHLNSKFRANGLDESGASLYDPNTFEARKGPYLPEANGNPNRLKDLYRNVGPFDGNEYVLCDVWRGVTHLVTGKRGGMPILYYKANTSKTAHHVNDPNNPDNIYDYRDNHALLGLGVPGKPGQKHPLYEDPKIFYQITKNTKVSGPSRPYRADTFILLSAGPDGLYGTKDDITNFDFRWKPK